MAYNLTRTSSQRVTTSSAFSGTGIQSIHLRLKFKTLPTSNSFPNRFWGVGFDSVSGDNRTPYFAMGQTNVLVGWYDGSAFRETTITVTHNTSDWFSYFIVWDFSSILGITKIYRDGILLGSFSANRGSPVTSTITTLGGNARTGEHSDIFIADYGFWNTELDLNEIISLAKGYACKKIREANLIRDIQLIRELQDLSSSTNVFFVNDPVPSPHPPTYQ
jgi:hypothetical protein